MIALRAMRGVGIKRHVEQSKGRMLGREHGVYTCRRPVDTQQNSVLCT